MLFFAFLLVYVCCNWSQTGHDEKNTYRSDYKSKSLNGWKYSYEGYDYVRTSRVVLDDVNGLLWSFVKRSKGYGHYAVVAIDLETGSSRIHKNVTCKDDIGCDSPIIFSSSGDMIYSSNKDLKFRSIKPDGSDGWSYDPSGEISRNFAIDQNDILIYQLDFGGDIRSVKYGSSIPLWTAPSHNLFGPFSISGDYLFIEGTTYPPQLKIIQTTTGKIMHNQKFVDGTNGAYKVVVHAEYKQFYLLQNDNVDLPISVLAMDDSTFQVKWNTTLFTDTPYWYCSDPQIVSKDRMVLNCKTDYIGPASQRFVVIDPKNGDLLAYIHKFNVSETCSTPAVFSDTKIITSCRVGSAYDILVVDLISGLSEHVVSQLPDVSNIVTDSTGCFFYCYGSGNDLFTCAKKCQ